MSKPLSLAITGLFLTGLISPALGQYRPPTSSYRPSAPSYRPSTPKPSYRPSTPTPSYRPLTPSYTPPPSYRPSTPTYTSPSYSPRPLKSGDAPSYSPPFTPGGTPQVATSKVLGIQDRVDDLLSKLQSGPSVSTPTAFNERGFIGSPSVTRSTVPGAKPSIAGKIDRLLAGRESNSPSPSGKSPMDPRPAVADMGVKGIQMPNLPWVDPGPLASPSPTKPSGAGAKSWIVEKGSLGDVLGKNDKVVAQFSTEAEADRFASDANHKAPLGTLYTVTQRPSQAANFKPAANADKPSLLADAVAKAYTLPIDISMPPPIKAPLSASVPAPSTRAPARGRIAGDRSGAGFADRAIEFAKWAVEIYEQYVEPAKQLKDFAENPTKPFENAIKDPPTVANIARKWMAKQGLDYLESLRDTRWMEGQPEVRRAVDSIIRMIREANDPSLERQMKDRLQNR